MCIKAEKSAFLFDNKLFRIIVYCMFNVYKEWTLSSVKVKATIVEDNTGIKSQLPILITEQGEVGSVTDYLLKMEADGASNALMNGFIQATSLLLDYR